MTDRPNSRWYFMGRDFVIAEAFFRPLHGHFLLAGRVVLDQAQLPGDLVRMPGIRSGYRSG